MKALTKGFSKTKISKEASQVSVQQLSAEALKDGYLCKRSSHHNKWKKRFFVLTTNGIYYFSTQNATQCKGLIKFLSYTSILPAQNETKKQLSFQILTGESVMELKNQGIFLMAETDTDMTFWMRSIYSALENVEKTRRRSFSFIPPENKRRKYRTLIINVAEAKDLTIGTPEVEEPDVAPVSSPDMDAIRCYPSINADHGSGTRKSILNSYTMIDIGNEQYRTRTTSNKAAPFWGEDFTIDFGEDEEFQGVTFTVWCENKARRPFIAGQVHVEEDQLAQNPDINQWFSLDHVNTSDFASGSLRLKWSFEDPTLTVRVVEGHNLAIKSKRGGIFVQASYVTQVHKTQSIRGTHNPFWNEDLSFINPFSVTRGQAREVKLTCYDDSLDEHGGFLGDLTIPFSRILEQNPHEETFVLHSRKARRQSSSNNNLAAINSSSCSESNGTPAPQSNVSSDANNTNSVSVVSSDNQPEVHLVRVPSSYQNASHNGSIRLSLRYQIENILPAGSYKTLQQVLPKPEGIQMSIALGSVVAGATERGQVSTSLVRAYDALGESTNLLVAVTTHEISSTEDPRIIFRGNTLGSKALDAYMKLIGTHFLHNTLGPFIAKVYEFRKSCEVDPTALKPGKDINKNIKRLQHLTQDALTAIYSSVDQCPSPLRTIFSNLQQSVTNKFTDEKVRYSVVSGFLFLRLFCAAILSPKLFGLAADHPDTKTERTLKLVAKVIQNIANLVMFEEKETYLKCMNPLITENIPLMKSFLDDISTPTSFYTPSFNTTLINIDRESAWIHSFLKAYKDELHQKYPEAFWIDTMDSVLRDLDLSSMIANLKE